MLKLKFFIKTSLSIAILFYVLISLENWIFDNANFKFNKLSLFEALGFGVFMGLFFTIYLFYKLEQLGLKEIKEEDLKPFQQRFVFSTLSEDEIAEKLKSKAPEFHIKGKDQNGIILKKDWSLESFGEKITLKPEKRQDQLGFLVTSKPIFYQWLDSGRGLSNVLKLQNLLTNQ